MNIRRTLSLVDESTGVAVDVVIAGEDTHQLGAVVAELRRLQPASGPLFLGDALLSETSPGTLAGIADGSAIGCGAPLAPIEHRPTAGRLELQVVGGPAAGTVYTLTAGRHGIGREGTIRIDDPTVSARHAVLDVRADEIWLEALDSTNGCMVEGTRIEGSMRLAVGEYVRLGNSVLALVTAPPSEHLLVPQPDGSLGCLRRLRPGAAAVEKQVAYPREPQPLDPPKFNIWLAIVPAIAGLAIAIFLNPLFAVFMLVGPLVAFANSRARTQSYRRRTDEQNRAFERDRAAFDAKLAALRVAERNALRSEAPNPAAVALIARGARRELWARRPRDADMLRLCVGLTNARSEIRVTGDDAPSVPSQWMVPISVPLDQVGAIAIKGDVADARGVARSLVLEIAALHAPTEVRLFVLTDQRSERDWGWVRWLPHNRPSRDDPLNLVASDSISTRLRLTELRALLARRKLELHERRGSALLPYIVVVYDGASQLMDDGFGDILRDGPALGVFGICIDERFIPPGCDAAVLLGEGAKPAVVEIGGVPSVAGVIVDRVDPETCEAAARCLTPVWPVDEGTATELPSYLRLLDVLDLHEPDADRVRKRWSTESRQARVVVGASRDGALTIDLTRDGPHAVVAGTTQSGKTEFLKTLIATLAAQNRPEDLSFLFIDFKGGNDYQLAEDLPHTVNLATQQDVSGFERSLVLLSAEIDRRQAVAKRMGTSSLAAYWNAVDKNGGGEPLGRLIVIVDEFAEMKQKHPAQIERLISVARVGAAYGVHLILAVQDPRGVVAGQIDANTALRLCFRVEDPAQSLEILRVPEAAQISERHRGRGFKRAHGEAPIEFQCARVANARPGARIETPLIVRTAPWVSVGHPVEVEEPPGEVPYAESDLYDLVCAMQAAALEEGDARAAVPWPAPLDAVIEVSSLSVGPDPGVPFARMDLPEEQSQPTVTMTLGAGHIAFAGSHQSGRTTALRTIAAGLVDQFSCAEVHLYAIDFLGTDLEVLGALPHCAGVASNDREVATRLIAAVEQQVTRRKAEFQRVGASDMNEYRSRVSGDGALPWLVLFVDGCEVLHEEMQSKGGAPLFDKLVKVLTEGARYGVQGVLGGDRNVAGGKIGRAVKHIFLLSFNSMTDFEMLGVPSRFVPAVMPPGRALTADRHLAQIGVVGAATGAAQVEALRAIVDRVRERDRAVALEQRPERIEPLPREVLFSDVVSRGDRPSSATGLRVLVGVGIHATAPVWIDLADNGAGFIVAGQLKSGRSNALAVMAASALLQGINVVAIAPPKSALATLDGRPGVTYLAVGDASSFDLGTYVDDAARTVVFLDNVDLLDANNPSLLRYAESQSTRFAMVAAGATDYVKNMTIGFVPNLRRAHRALLLWPESGWDGPLFGLKSLPETMVFEEPPPGRGVLGLGGELEVVQIPRLDPAMGSTAHTTLG